MADEPAGFLANARFAPPRADVDAEPRPARLHRVTALMLAVLIGGPIAGGIMVVRNFMVLGRRREAWIAGALFAALFGVSYYFQTVTPRDWLSVQVTVGLPRLLAATAIAWVLQRQVLQAHKRVHGEFQSRWLGVAIGVAVLLAKAIVFGAWFYLPDVLH